MSSQNRQHSLWTAPKGSLFLKLLGDKMTNHAKFVISRKTASGILKSFFVNFSVMIKEDVLMRQKQAVKRNPTWFDSDPNPHLWFSEFPNSIPSLRDGLLCNSCVIKIRSCSDAYYITIVFRNTYRYSDGVMEYSSKKSEIIFF